MRFNNQRLPAHRATLGQARQLLARTRSSSALLLAVALAGPAAAGELPEGDPEAGQRFYREGLNRNGETVPVQVQGDIQATSNQFTCVGCHRPSGFGSSEGGEFVPFITSDVLFSDRDATQQRRNRQFRELFKETHSSDFDAQVKMPRMRPAYTRETLARAIRGGVDSAGEELSETMPRYQISDQTAADLIAYLKTLSTEDDPGVSDDILHIGTVIGSEVGDERRRAVVQTMRLFVEWYNKDIQGQLEHEGFSPFYRSEFKDSFRKWKLHVWDLDGPPSTWRNQLEARYADKKVFAMVSGLVDERWEPVADFCDAQRLPCVFPNTQLPRTEDATYNYSIYFSRGLELEGEALAVHLGNQEQTTNSVQQVHVSSDAGRVPARAFSRQATDEMPDTTVTTRKAADRAELKSAIADAANEGGMLAIWPGADVQVALKALNQNADALDQVFLPSAALDPARANASNALTGKLRFTYPNEKPEGYHPRQYRVRAWMHSRGLEVSHSRIQLQTYYALTQMQYGVSHLISDFNRDYLIEFIEKEAEAELNPGTHPKLALGPGQRFASKGAYVMALETDSDGETGYKAVSDWIVP
jgi:mono/diheme cytochrome c family protein